VIVSVQVQLPIRRLSLRNRISAKEKTNHENIYEEGGMRWPTNSRKLSRLLMAVGMVPVSVLFWSSRSTAQIV
jgi:hypothetical protein